MFSEPTGLLPVAAPEVPALPLRGLYVEYLEALEARGMMAQSLVSARNTLTHLTEFEAARRRKIMLADYTGAMHDKFLGHLRQVRKLAPNTVAKSVKHLKAFLRHLRDDRQLALAIELRQVKVHWAEVEKMYLTAAELALLETVELSESLVATRDAFLFCCYTGLRHSDLHDLSVANVREWDGSRLLRLTQTKTRTAVSIYLSASAAALLDKYAGTRAGLLPAYTNQAMNRNLKEIYQLAGLGARMEVVTVEQGRVVKRNLPKYRLVTMHTARHTFAAGGARVLAAPVSVDEQAGAGLAQGQGLFEGRQHEFGGHLRGQVPAHHAPRAGIAPGGQVAPAPTQERQVGEVPDPDPDPVQGRGRGLARQPVFGHHGGRVGHGGARPLWAGAERLLAGLAQPGAQRIAAHGGAFGATRPAIGGCRSGRRGAGKRPGSGLARRAAARTGLCATDSSRSY